MINEYAIKVKPGKIDKMLVNPCKVFNNGGMGDPIVQRFNASQEYPTIRPHDVISRIHKYTPIMWGNLRGNKGLLDALDYLDKDYFHIDHAYFGRGHDHKNYSVSYLLDLPDPLSQYYLIGWESCKSDILKTKYF